MKTRQCGRHGDDEPAQVAREPQTADDVPYVYTKDVHSARFKKARPGAIKIPERFPCNSDAYTPVRSGRSFTPGGSLVKSTDNLNLEMSSVGDDQPRMTLDDILTGKAPRPSTPGWDGPTYMGVPTDGNWRRTYKPTSEDVQFPEFAQSFGRRRERSDADYYALLQERQKPCSGRDELCNSVLNDEWASHPTWASEDSGFIAHKKNVHEEGLHRIEEERHDYDYNIESCGRTIQLLEPLAQQIRRFSDGEQMAFKLPPGLGGQSETIYKRVIMKVYGREKGQEVCTQLHNHPYQVIPVLLNRLKERIETWKLAQREWEKVWREQTQKMFWKSLDHQWASAKSNEKRATQMKTLQTEIAVKHEEMKRSEKQTPGAMRQPQLEYSLDDTDVVMDVSHLLLVYIDQMVSHDMPQLLGFVKEFIPLFLGLDQDWFNAQVNARLSAAEAASAHVAATQGFQHEDTPSGTEDVTPSRGRKAKSSNLLRNALDKGGRSKLGRKDREDSNASASRASTPDVGSVAEDEMAVDTGEETESKADSTTRWLDHPSGGNTLGDKSVDPNEPYVRHIFRMWANGHMYCFVRLFIMLYERLLTLKHGEAECRETVRKGQTQKPAVHLGIVDKLPSEFFEDISPTANYYRQMLDKFEKGLTGEADWVEIEDTLRRFYLQNGYQLYALDKIVTAFAKSGNNIVVDTSSKEKTYDIYSHYKRDRVKASTTALQQTDYRKSVEKMLKDSELYRIDYVSIRSAGQHHPSILTISQDQETRAARIYLVKRDDPTFDDSLSTADREHRWRYYLASYTALPATEGIATDHLTRPILTRNLRASGANPNSTTYPPSPLDSAAEQRIEHRFDHLRGEEKLVMRIGVETYQTVFQPNTQEGWFEVLAEREGGKEDVEMRVETGERRKEDVRDKFEIMNKAMEGAKHEDVERAKDGFLRVVEGKVAEGGDEMEVDE